MHQNYSALVEEIRTTTIEAFNGQPFKLTLVHGGTSKGSIVSGSERNLSGYDSTFETQVDVTEQYVLARDAEGEPTPGHYLQIGWKDDEEHVSVNLDTGELDTGIDKFMNQGRFLSVAQNILRLIELVRPEVVPEIPDNDTERLQDLVDFANRFHDELSPVFAALASRDRLVAAMARHQAKGRQYGDSQYERFRQRISHKYGITREAVDYAVDIRLLRYIQRREKRLSADKTPD